MRHWFGQTLTDWSMTLGEQTEIETEAGAVKVAAVSAVGPKAITFWNAATGGTQYEDLLDASGSPITQVTASDGTGGPPLGTIPRFQGPDGSPEVTEMWADAGGGARYLMLATDLGASLGDLDARVGAVEPNVADLAESPAWVRRNPVTGVWPARPETGRMVIWLDTLPETPLPPAIGGTGMTDNLDLYFGSA